MTFRVRVTTPMLEEACVIFVAAIWRKQKIVSVASDLVKLDSALSSFFWWLHWRKNSFRGLHQERYYSIKLTHPTSIDTKCNSGHHLCD